MTDQARTPTTEALREAEARIYRMWSMVPLNIKAQIMAQYPDGYDPTVSAIREAAAALLAAEQREAALREMLTREEYLVGAARSVLSNYENEDGVIPYAKVIDDMRFLAIAVSSEPPATGEK